MTAAMGKTLCPAPAAGRRRFRRGSVAAGLSPWVCRCGSVAAGLSPRVCRGSVTAGLSPRVCRCGSVAAGLSLQVSRCGSVAAGLSLRVCRCGSFAAVLLLRVCGGFAAGLSRFRAAGLLQLDFAPDVYLCSSTSHPGYTFVARLRTRCIPL
eukprot:1190359-Prorocentrum_minimum.AAC.3